MCSAVELATDPFFVVCKQNTREKYSSIHFPGVSDTTGASTLDSREITTARQSFTTQPKLAAAALGVIRNTLLSAQLLKQRSFRRSHVPVGRRNGGEGESDSREAMK